MLQIKKIILLIFGGVFLSLGVVGIFIPILPTTPFLLLAASCFLKSSHAAYRWLMSHKLLGRYVYQYRISKSLPLKTKISALFGLWITIIISVFIIPIFWVKLLVLFIAICVTFHIAKMKTMSATDKEHFEREYQKFLENNQYNQHHKAR